MVIKLIKIQAHLKICNIWTKQLSRSLQNQFRGDELRSLSVKTLPIFIRVLSMSVPESETSATPSRWFSLLGHSVAFSKPAGTPRRFCWKGVTYCGMFQTTKALLPAQLPLNDTTLTMAPHHHHKWQVAVQGYEEFDSSKFCNRSKKVAVQVQYPSISGLVTLPVFD